MVEKENAYEAWQGVFIGLRLLLVRTLDKPKEQVQVQQDVDVNINLEIRKKLDAALIREQKLIEAINKKSD